MYLNHRDEQQRKPHHHNHHHDCYRPLDTDGHGETDGAADGDVVERVEKLCEEKSVETAVKGERP